MVYAFHHISWEVEAERLSRVSTTELRSCLENITHFQKSKSITQITRRNLPGHAWKRLPEGAAAAPSETACSPHCWPGRQHHLQMGLGSQHRYWDWQCWKQVVRLYSKGLETYSWRRHIRHCSMQWGSANLALSEATDEETFLSDFAMCFTLNLCWFWLNV